MPSSRVPVDPETPRHQHEYAVPITPTHPRKALYGRLRAIPESGESGKHAQRDAESSGSPNRLSDESSRKDTEAMAADESRAFTVDSLSRLVLTMEEAAEWLCIGRTNMYALVAAGDVESVTIGRLRRVPVDALRLYVERLRTSQGVA